MKFLLSIFLTLLLPVCARTQVSPLFLEPTKKQADSLRMVLTKTSNDTIRMAALRELALYYLDINSDSAFYYIKQELPIVKKLGLKIWESDALDLNGLILTGLGDYPRALQSFIKSIKIAEDRESGNTVWRISKFTNGDDPNVARLTMLATIYLDISGLYLKTANPDKAEFYIRESIRIVTPLKDYTILSLAYNRLGEIYYNNASNDTAIIYFQDALKYSARCGYTKYKSSTLNSLALLFMARQNYRAAKQYYTDALLSAAEQNNMPQLGQTNINLSRLYLITGPADSSYYYAKLGENILLKTGRLADILSAYNQLAQVYKQQNKTDSALFYLELANVVNDSLNNSKKVRQFQNIGFDQQLKLQELEKEKIQTQNKIRTYGLSAGIFTFLLIAFLLFRNNRKEKKAKNLLQDKNKEVERTLLELKATQSQLIQSEKMASLGELTAGIAHEIQNPLNFVNNFSEVNTELIEELSEEARKGNLEEVQNLAQDIKTNEQKISHHGKRADAIVKGMLQHSSSSKGAREPTDINALCDEYLRLSYHGLRAKDESFNATLKTDFDGSIGNINIITQDIGRVLLNLINNAFYAVDEKKKLCQAQGNNSYEPTVFVSTKRIGDKVEIKVVDNGNGIPQKILDKIFQPFFTTKPTGKGTGLGLSLSYDIVKTHGGEIKVGTLAAEAAAQAGKEHEGTEFIIQLPLQ